MSPARRRAPQEDGPRAGSGERGLRADAARNRARIHRAALAAFHGRGLDTPLDSIAAAAGVSKATIYTHFGGRDGLIDAVITELIAERLQVAIAEAGRNGDPWQRLADWVVVRRDLQYREPAFTDVMLGAHPGSRVLPTLASEVSRATTEFVDLAREAGVVRDDLTAADLFWADAANGLALRSLSRPRRADYDRRTTQFIDSLRPR